MRNKVTYINIAVSVILILIEIYVGIKFVDILGVISLMALLFYIAIITVLIVTLISAVICSRGDETNKDEAIDDVERVMAVLESDNLIKVHEGPLTTDRISINLQITAVKKHQSPIDLEEVHEDV